MNEQEYLQKIDEIHQWLLREPTGQIENRHWRSSDGYAYVRKAKELFNLVRKMRDELQPDYVSITDHDIEDILEDEIKYVELSYQKTLKNKVLHKDKDYFEKCIYDANDVIDRRLAALFEHIIAQKTNRVE